MKRTITILTIAILLAVVPFSGRVSAAESQPLTAASSAIPRCTWCGTARAGPGEQFGDRGAVMSPVVAQWVVRVEPRQPGEP